MTKRRSVSTFIAELSPEPETSLPISTIVLPTSQPRRYFDEDKLNQLADSIREHSIIEPLIVRPLADKYELVAGERRYRAAQIVGLDSVPVVIRELNDEQALTFSLIENLAREDLNPIEETEGILALLGIELGTDKKEVISLLYRLENEQKGKATHNVMGSQEAAEIESLFDGLGQTWSSFVANRLPLLKLPEEILNKLREGKIAYTKATAIAKVKDQEVRNQLLEEAIADSLSLSQIRERIQTLKPHSKPDNDILNRFKTVYGQAKKSKTILNDSKKQKKLETLLVQMEKLLAET